MSLKRNDNLVSQVIRRNLKLNFKVIRFKSTQFQVIRSIQFQVIKNLNVKVQRLDHNQNTQIK